MKKWEYIILILLLMLLSGCGTINAGFTSTSSDGEYRTTVVVGFAVIREKILKKEVEADVTDISSFGLLFDSKTNRLGVGYLSDTYSRIFKPFEANILLDVQKKDGKLSIEFENVKPNKEVKDEKSDGDGLRNDGPVGCDGTDKRMRVPNVCGGGEPDWNWSGGGVQSANPESNWQIGLHQFGHWYCPYQ
jgi:hypothetical protein